jgi:hypothetical protein
MAHMAVSRGAQADAYYRQAVATSFGVRSIAGLESILLTGLNNAFVANDRDGALAGLSALACLPAKSRSTRRPVVFVDMSSSLITILTTDEFELARTRLLRQSANSLFLKGIGTSVRSLGMAPPRTMENHFDQSTCRAWVEMLVSVGGVIAIASNLEVVAGLGIISRIIGGLRIISLKEFLAAGALGFTAGRYISTPICSGLAWVANKGSGGNSQGSSNSGDVAQPSVSPGDLGVSPSDFRPDKPEGTGNQRQNPQQSGPGPAPTGTAEEGDGFDAVQVNGPSSVTLTAQDGSSVQVTTDADGNTVVVNYDIDGHATSIDTYDAQGNKDDNGLSIESGGTVPDDESGGTVPDESGGYPVPDGDSGPGGPAGRNPEEYPVPDGDGGPGGPAGFTASLVAYPKPDDLGTDPGHPSGPAALVGLGATYHVAGLSGFRLLGAGVF